MEKTLTINLFLISLVALACATAAQAQPTGAVYSANIVGIQKISAVSTNQGGLVLISNPFLKKNSNLDSVLGTNGVAGTTLGNANNVLVYDAANQKFNNYWLFSNPRRWVSSSGFATNVNLVPGAGIWYRNRASTNLPLTLVGDVVTAASVTNLIYPGLQVLSYPYSAPITLGKISLTNGIAGTTLATADNIQLYFPETQTFSNYWLLSSANQTFNRKWIHSGGFATNVTIQPGQSFWYRSRSNVITQWIENIPYVLSN